VSNYRIERLIGIGGAAVVYQARPLLAGGDGPPVACKLMRAECRADRAARALVRQEAALGLRITPGQPDLVRVLDYFEDAGEGPCLVMELVDGGSLKALLGPDRLPFPVTRRLITEVLQTLAHLHDVEVLHRDLSPCNILISSTGSVKVADLGIARVMERGQTCTKNYRGKLAYDSPEGIQTLTLDARSDLYTLGAVLYELLSGTPPCGEKEEFAHVVIRTMRGDFAPLPPDAPADLAALAMGLLRTERDAREPQTATGALALLRRHDQPMASQAELAALVMDMKSRRGAEPDGAHRAPSLAPGEMLEPGDVLVARTDMKPGEPIPDAVPVQLVAPVQPPVFPLPPEPPLPPLPQPLPSPPFRPPPRVTAQLAPLRDHAPDPQSSGPALVAGPSRPRREVMYRAVGRTLLLFCVLVSGFLLHDRFRGERSTGSTQQRLEVPAPVVVPTPAPPVHTTPARPVAETDRIAGPRHSRKKQHVDGLRPTRIRTQGHTRSVQPDEPSWEPVPLRSEHSAWATP
jgi:serine/threonine protein kinase